MDPPQKVLPEPGRFLPFQPGKSDNPFPVWYPYLTDFFIDRQGVSLEICVETAFLKERSMNKIFSIITFVMVILLVACSSGSKTLGTEEPVMVPGEIVMNTIPAFIVPTQVPTQAPPPTVPAIELPHPIPASGKGNLVGQVRWNETGASGINLKICTEFSWFGGCKGTIYTTTSDPEGIYMFKDIDPGQYALTLKVFDTGNWLYMTTGLMTERMYTIRSAATTEVGVSDIYKTDMKSIQPAEKAKVAEVRPVLKWEDYPDASRYELWLNPEKGDAVAVSEELTTYEFIPEEDLLNCEYTWKVEAFNDNGIKISEMDDYRHFTVTGAQYSCAIKMIKPLNNTSVPSSGIELEWEAHPLADYYKLFMWPENDSSIHILDFIEVRATNYTITDTLQAGKYVLSIYAYDANGKQVANSGITYVIVK